MLQILIELVVAPPANRAKCERPILADCNPNIEDFWYVEG